MSNNRASQALSIEESLNQKQRIPSSTNIAKLLQTNAKNQNGHTRLILTGDQTKQIIRSARSGSVKQKLNLENTRLKINVENLSSLITVHQNNEAKFRIELDRYKQKVLRYKQKIKQKDNIIAKLLQKLQRKIQIDGGSLQNLILKLHQQHIKGFKSKINRGQVIDVQQILNKYQQLFKGFTKQQKQRMYLQKEKEDLQKTVFQLKQTIKYVGQGRGKDKQSQIRLDNERLKIKIGQIQAVLEKQRKLRNTLVETIRSTQSEIQPDVKAMIVDVERERGFLKLGDQDQKAVQLTQHVEGLKKKLAQSQINLLTERQTRKGTQKHCGLIQQQLQQISKKVTTTTNGLQSLQSRLQKIQQLYSKQLRQLQQKTSALGNDSTSLQHYKSHIDQLSHKFSQTIKNFSQQSQKWAKLQNQYQKRIDQLRNNKRYLQDRLQKQTQKRRLFELKLMGQDQNVENVKNVDIENQENMGRYLDQRVQVIKKESLRNKKENQNLSQQLSRGKRAYDILERELKDADQKIYKLQQILKKNKISLANQPTSSPFQQPQPQQSDSPSKKTNIRQPQTSQQYIQAYSDYKTHNQFLENQIKQLRAKYIDLQMDLEQSRNAVENMQIQNARILENSRRKEEEAGKRPGGNSGKILAEGQPYLEKSSVEGGYKVNIINVNQIPEEIQKMSFEDLSIKYLQAKDQLLYLKQKMQQSFASQPSHPPQKRTPKLDMILSQNQNQPEDGTSQSVDQDTYKNINQQMDRLVSKNKQLQKQLIQQKIQKQSQVQGLNILCIQLKDKLKSAEEINNNLSNIVVHLESQLSRYQNNLDSSMQEQRGSQVMEASGKSRGDGRYGEGKAEDMEGKYGEGGEAKYYGDGDNIAKKIEEKKRQFEDMLKSGGTSENNKQPVQYQNKLKALELQIRSLKQKQGTKQKSTSKLPSPDTVPPSQCPNCQSLTKLSSQLVTKLQKLQQSNTQKLTNYKTQLQQIQPSSQPTLNPQQLQKQNTKLRQLIAQIKTQLNYEHKEREEYQNQIKNIREINEELVSSIHQKEKAMLKLRTDLYRQNFDKLGIDQGSARKIQDIFQSYEKKIQELENAIKGQQKSQVNISDLYDTINYLNTECQNLRKNLQQFPPSDSHSTHPHSLHALPHPQFTQQLPSSYQQLSKKYLAMSQHHQSLSKFAQQNNFKSITQMLQNAQQQKQKNIQLMKQNNKLQNKIANMNIKYQQYFKKINQGKVYEIIQDKDKEIDGIKEENAGFKGQLENLERERREMFQENQKINQDLKNIQDNILKLTGGKTMLESTLPDRSQSSKNFDKSTLSPKQKKPSNEQSQYILQNMSRKIQLLKNAIQNSSHKTRPSFEIQSFQQIPSLEDIIIILLDRLHYTWNLVEQRTVQYNQLRDQMNIISMQCMKNGQFQLDTQKSRESQNKIKQAEIIQERYQEVLAQLVEYQNQNKRLEKEVNRLKQQLGVYKRQVEEVQSKYVYQLKSQSSEDLPYNKQVLNKFLESSSVMVTSVAQKELPEIIKLFLARIKELEGNLQSIQLSFDQKNRKLQSLIQKQKSFISQKSRVKKDESQPSQNSSSRNKDGLQQSQRNDIVSPLIKNPSMPVSIGDQKSYYSMNSVKLFKQIEQLTRTNEQLREKNQRYRNLLEHFTQLVEVVLSNKLKNTVEEKIKNQMQKLVINVNSEIQDEGRRDNSGFDLENDQILGSSFSKREGSQQIEQRKGLQQIQDSLQGPKSVTNLSKSRKQQEQANKRILLNTKFLEQNKFLFQQLFQKLEKLQKTEQSIDRVKTVLAQKLSDKQLQQMLYLLQPDKAVTKILKVVAESSVSEKKAKFNKEKKEKKEENVLVKEKQFEEGSIEEGEWVETAQLQAIINQIYPIKTQLCLMVANSINMLMMAQTKQGILKAVEFLFTNLKNKQNQFKQQMRRRDQSVTQYGRKLQKLLASKYSQDESQQKNQIMNQNSFRRAAEIKSENQIQGQAGYARSRNNLTSSEDSQSYSRITFEK